MSAKSNSHPPKWADKLLEWYCRNDRLEQIQGDMYELFFLRLEEKGHNKASQAFAWDMLKSFRLENIRKNKTQTNISMILNYIKVGWRNLKSQKTPSLINIFGLSCAIACSIVAYMFVSSKVHRDRFHENVDNIYMLTHTALENDEMIRYGQNSEVIGEQIGSEISDFEHVVRINSARGLVKRGTDVFFEPVKYVDSDFYEMFDFPLKYGSTEELQKPDRVAITTLAAKKYFNDEYPIGEQLQMSIAGQIKTLTVGAVIFPAPENSTINFNFLLNYELTKDFYPEKSLNPCVMVQLKESIDMSNLEGFSRLINVNNGLNPDNPYIAFQLEPLKTINSNSNEIDGGLGHGSNPAPMILLSVIAILLLLLAIFNYLNIAIMMASKRIKEIGTRKVMGAVRSQVVVQFLVENLIVCFFALILGVFIAANFFIPWFNDLSNGAHKINFLDPNIWYFFLTILTLIGITSGAYPAWYISSFQPAMIFRGNLSIKKSGFTSALLTFQFALALVTIVTGMTIIQTNHNNAARDWGYTPESLLVFNTPTLQDNIVLKEKLATHPNVISIVANTHSIGNINEEKVVKIDGENYDIDILKGAYNYANVMGLRLQKGRFFQENSKSFSNILVNETFMKAYSIDFEAQASIIIDSTIFHIVGVVQDFHHYDFHSEIAPIAIMKSTQEELEYLTVKVVSGTENTMLEEVKIAYHAQVSDVPFYGYLQPEVFEHYFKDVKSISDLLMFTAFLAIVLSAMGLYGLVSLMIANSMKVFSIKKVLGANNMQLSAKLYKKFGIMLTISAVVGGLICLNTISLLLNNLYSYHDELSILHILIAVIILSSVVGITIFGLMNKMKRTNPADILRTE